MKKHEKKTIEQIESDLHHAFPEYPLYRAWTSPRIRAKRPEAGRDPHYGY